MFGLFSSPRKKALNRADVFFKNQFSELCRWDDVKIGLVLDMAADIKMSSIQLDSSGEAKRIYGSIAQSVGQNGAFQQQAGESVTRGDRRRRELEARGSWPPLPSPKQESQDALW